VRNRLTSELAVCGFNAAAAAGLYHPERINRLFLREDRFRAFTKVCKNLAERKRPYKVCGDEELERLCKSRHHQGVVAMIEAPALAPLTRDDLASWAAGGKTGVVLHSVGNDHNLGAIARAAAFFDAPFIVLSEKDPDAGLTTAAYRVAEGGMEHVQVRTVRSAAAFLADASRTLLTIGTDRMARRRIRDLPQIARGRSGAAGGRPGIALVLGNEETGLPPEVKDACSVVVRIPGTGLMDSLNVSQAAAVFLHEIYEL